jgi:hypothetical protein
MNDRSTYAAALYTIRTDSVKEDENAKERDACPRQQT